MTDINQILKKYYGYDSFRPGQFEIVTNIMRGRDICAVMPTGAGKSICYQIPALAMDGVTLVISPLISLMQDQVRILKSIGVPAAYFNSSLTPRQVDLAISRAAQGAYKIIYAAPERLESPKFIEFVRKTKISLIAVDEAHCISVWGHEFRPSYRRITKFVDKLAVRPVIAAFTATASETVKQDIVQQLNLKSPYCITASFDRPNLYFGAISIDDRDTKEFAADKKMEWMCNYLQKHKDESGIVYCLTKKQTEIVAENLSDLGYSSAAYHAGMNTEKRKQIQEDFTFGKIKIIAATTAFGMGIDKPDVRFVIHYDMPSGLEDYYQQAGRAGRDGEDAECILLYSYRDYCIIRDYFILRPHDNEQNDGMTAAERKDRINAKLENLNKMKSYALSQYCLRRNMLSYFGEKSPERCGKCSFCRKNSIDKQIVRITPKDFDEELYIKLKAKVKILSILNGVPVYTIAGDGMLKEMASLKPMNVTQMKKISGLGEEKIRRYGDEFLKIIIEHIKQKR